MLKKVCSLLLATTLLTGMCSTLTANAAEKEGSNHTPNVSTLTLKSDKNISKYYNANGDEVDLSSLNASTFSRRRAMLPSKFDLRDEGKSTSVKDQSVHGFCWSFASTASMESNILTQKLGNATSDNLDLSETGGSWFSCNGTTDKSDSTYGDHRDDPFNGTQGGNAHYAAESISSGYGAYPEELAKYDDISKGYSESLRYYSDYKLKDYSSLPNDVNLIKQLLMEKGAMYYAYNSFIDNYYETADGQWTYSDNGKSIFGETTEDGHAVTLVGWDDTFSKDNFHPDAGVTRDGAWLCKNSWGDYWGNEGYFWVSYENFAYNFGQFEMQDKDSFDTIHQHQTSGDQFMFGGQDEENPQYFSSANVFTAKTTEELKQICYSNAVNSNVTAKIYKLNKNYTSPTDGELLTEFDSNVDYAGTHCLDVPGNITFNAGDTFSVVIEGESLMPNFRLEDDKHPANDTHGKSYFTENGTDWTDVADFSEASYAAIKAYTTKSEVDKTELANIVDTFKNFKPSNAGEQVKISEPQTVELLGKADKLLADDNATNTDIKNLASLLNAKWENVKMEAFTVNNLDDFKILYEGVRKGKFTNKYVEINTDLDLSDFDITDSGCSIEDFENGYWPEGYYETTNLYLDGNGHTLKNFTTSKYSTFLFGSLLDSTIKNLNIENFNVEGVLNTSLLVGSAVNSKFININVNNATINAPESQSSALLVSYSESCTFTDCAAENCKIVSGEYAGLFFSDLSSSTEAINCTAKNYTMYAHVYVDDNMGFDCTYQSENYYDSVSIKVTDNECTIEQVCGQLESVKLNGTEITPVSSQFIFDKPNNSVVLDIKCSYDEPYEFDFVANIEKREVKVITYSGTEKDIVIPEKIYGQDVVGLYGKFYTHEIPTDEVNSVTVPGVVKSIPYKYFTSIFGLQKLILNEGVEEICNNICEGCENLTEINLPDSIRTIGKYAFFNCGAKSITLGKNIESIGEKALGYHETESGVKKIEDFTIYGYANTAAETYANTNGFNFVDLSISAQVA